MSIYDSIAQAEAFEKRRKSFKGPSGVYNDLVMRADDYSDYEVVRVYGPQLWAEAVVLDMAAERGYDMVEYLPVNKNTPAPNYLVWMDRTELY